ncbi:hypothetical protein CP987_19510, partial [Morganella morganii]
MSATVNAWKNIANNGGFYATKDIPSWRRVCKVLLNNDYWCRQLSFSPTKSSH